MFRLIALVQSGGWMIVPILVASVITVALIFEVARSLSRSRKRLESYLLNPKSGPAPGDRDDAVSSLIAYRAANPQATSEELQTFSELAFGQLERKLSWLQTIAAIAPLLGLLGTVSGMIHNFSLVASTRPTNPLAQLSAGISEALVATAGGLVVALIAAVAYHWLSNALEALFSQVQSMSLGGAKAPARPEEVSFGA